jgi:hypothetical protein
MARTTLQSHPDLQTQAEESSWYAKSTSFDQRDQKGILGVFLIAPLPAERTALVAYPFAVAHRRRTYCT